MNIYLKQKSKSILVKLLLIIMLVTVILPLSPCFFQENQRMVFAVESFDNLAIKAVKNSYGLHQGGLATDGDYSHFGAYDAYILTQAGANVNNWVYNETSLQAGVLSLIDATISNEGTANNSSAKRVAQEYLAAKQWADLRAVQLLTNLKNRQTASGNGSFDATLYGIYSNMPAFEALGRAGDLAEIDTAAAISYILSCQDTTTKAWPTEDAPNWITNDFTTTAQAVRSLNCLEPLAGAQAVAVQTAIIDGTAWLQSRQQTDGSFRDAAGFDDPLVDTAETILTLNCLAIDPATWTVGGKSAVDYMRDNALNGDGTFGASKNLVDDTWAIDAYRVLGGNVAPETELGIKVSPAAANILVNETSQYTATAFKMDGSDEDVSATAAWTVDDTDIAAVNASGLVTGVAAGNAVVTATKQDISGTASVTVAEGGGDSPQQQGIPVSVTVTGAAGETLFSQTVTLQAQDVHGLTPVGALDKTSLSYSYDSIDYIHTIAGLGPQGMCGWMYKVNSTTPGVSAIMYTLAAHDQVLWFYSTDSANIAEVDGGIVITPAKEKTGDELIKEALDKAQEVRISLENSEDKTVKIAPDSIRQLNENNREMSLTNQGIELTFTPNALYTEQLTKALGEDNATLQLGAREVTASEKQELLANANIGQSTGLFEIGGKMVDLTAQIVRESSDGAKDTEILTSFNEPVKITLDLSGLTLTEEETAKLTSVRYEKDASGNIIPVKLGGSYDPATKTFTFYTEQFSYYGIVKAANLVTVSMRINMLTTTVNGTRSYTDVPPILLNNRTLVPLRFIAESLGADVQWMEKERTVDIRLDERLLQLVIDQTEQDLSTAAAIVNGRTMVPLRYVAESLGARVTWFSSNQRIELVK